MHRLVCPFILERFASGQASGQLDAATLFVDMSGFSAMTSAMMHHGQQGAEVLATVMRAIFDPLVRTVYAHGGFITVFAGDAFTAVFPTSLAGEWGERRGGENHALAAAWSMRQHVLAQPQHVTPYGTFEVGAKIGLSTGAVSWRIVRSDDSSRATFYFRGEAINACAQTESHARRGDLVLHPAVQPLLSAVVTVGALADGYARVTDVLAPLPQPQPVRLVAPDPAVLTRFFPRSIVEQVHTGEFREAINVFVGLQGEPTETQLTRLMQSVFELQQKYGGLLNRVDFGDKGCCLLLFWGAPVSHEDDVLRALSFLLDLHDRTELLVRAGVTAHISHAGFIGSELHEEYTCYGVGVNLAARLMMAASWESIWVDESIRIRAEHQFELAPEGHLLFKGHEQEQPVYSLMGPKTADMVDFFERKMIGRERELAVLEQFVRPLFVQPQIAEVPAFSQNASGAVTAPVPVSGTSAISLPPRRFAGILVVRGEAGIGKSRLIHDFQTLCLPTATTTVALVPRWCRCQSNQIVRQPLNPFRYWLQDYFSQSPTQSEAYNKRMFSHKLGQLIGATADTALRDELEHTRSILGALIDLHWQDSLFESLDPQSRYESTLSALKTFILAESLRQPLVLHLEDVHWLDEDSVAFVQRLVRDIEAYPIAILAAARPEGDAPLFGSGVDYLTIDLAGLSSDDLAALATNLLGGPPGPELLGLLVERSDGNPFFAEQILFYLRDEGLLQPVNGAWRVLGTSPQTSLLPGNIRAIFIARIDRLTQDVREVVQNAAVLGREFEVEVLARMLRGHAVHPWVEEAEHAAIWLALTEVRYLFKHVLLRDAAYNMQVGARRAQLHRLAAEALEMVFADDLPAHTAEIAYHYEAACQLGLVELAAQAREYLKKAGQQAKDRYENAAAIDTFTRALALCPDDDPAARFELVHAREAVYDTRGERASQAQDLTNLEALAEMLDDARRAEAALRRSNYAERVSDFATAIAAAERAISLAQAAGDVDREAWGYWSWGTALWRVSDYAEARAQLERARALAHAANLAGLEADVRLVLAFVAQEQGKWAEVDCEVELALAMYRQQRDLAGEMAALNTLGISCHEQADYAGARAYFEQALGLARQAGRRLSEARYLNNLANAWQGLGNLAKSQAYLEQALRLSREVGHRDGEAVVLSNLATVAVRQGDLARAVAGFEHALAILHEVRHRGQESETLAYLGGCQALAGDYEAARENCQQALQIARELESRSLEGMPLTNLGHALLGLGQLDRARQTYQAALEVREALNQLDAAMEARAGLARVALAEGDVPAALAELQPVVTHLEVRLLPEAELLHGLAGAEDPLWVYLTWHQAWAAAGDLRAAEPLEQAYSILQATAAGMEDDTLRQGYLQNIPSHRQIIAAYQALRGGGPTGESLPAETAALPAKDRSQPAALAGLAGEALRGADLSHADLRGAVLAGMDLRGADLSHAQLCEADLSGADLRRVDLTGADLRGANFTGAQLRGADLTDAIYDASTVWPPGFDPTLA